MTLYSDINEIPVFNYLMIYKTNNFNWLYKEFYTDSDEYNFIFSNIKDFQINLFLKISGTLKSELSILDKNQQKTIIIKTNEITKEIYFDNIHILYPNHFYYLRNTNDVTKQLMYLNELRDFGKIIVDDFLTENEFIEKTLNIEIDLGKTTLSQWIKLYFEALNKIVF